jgi:TPR repeat protein/serine/threonine protein kinase
MPAPDPRDPNAPPAPAPAEHHDTAAPAHTQPAGTAAPGTPPARFGRFEVRGFLGAGAYASVYLAFDTQLERSVAVKVPKAEERTKEFCEAFVRENRLAARISHTHVCPVYEVGEQDGVPYIVMRMVPDTLAGLLTRLRGSVFVPSALNYASQLAQGLAAAHAENVIHRDLKPANVLYDDRKREVLIADFGLARFADQATAASNGVPKGTPAYMAPEQARGQADKVGPHSDIYALGVILYELLTGRVPFSGSIWEVMRDHCETAPKPPSALRPGLDPRLDALCLKALAKDPRDRYRTAKEFARAIDDLARALQAPVPPKLPAPAPVPAPPQPQPQPVVEKSKPVPPPPPRTEPKPEPEPLPEPTDGEPRAETNGRRAALFWGGLAALLLVGVIGGLLLSQSNRSDKRETPRAEVPDAKTDPAPEPKKKDPEPEKKAPEPVPKKDPVALELARDWADYKLAAYSTGSAQFLADRGPGRWTEWKRAAEAGDTGAMVMYARCLGTGSGATKDLTAAFEWLQKAAARGEPIAMNNLGFCYDHAEGTARDSKRALEWYQKAAEAGEPIAMNNLGNCYENGTGTTIDLKKAFEWYKKASEAGNRFGTANYARCWEAGTGTASDQFLARALYKKAAELDVPDGMVGFGRMCATGRGGATDLKAAREWFEKASLAGSAAGTYELAELFDTGKGTTVEKDRAHALYLKAADKGHAMAQFRAGYNFGNGTGTNQDWDKAREWYEKAAAQGIAAAMNNLGVIYDDGRGVKQNYEKAREWFEKGAAGGDVFAMNNLGLLYLNGDGVDADPLKAKEWFEKSAAKNHAPGQYNLGRLYERGIKRPGDIEATPDLSEALKWYKKAADGGHENAKTAVKRLEDKK